MTQHQPSLNNVRTDIVGSFLRPPGLKEVRISWERSEVADDELREAEDEAVRDLISKEESTGLPVVTDGEFRRNNFQDSFATTVSGINVRSTATPVDASPGGKSEDPTINRRRIASERLSLVRNVLLNEFRFAQSVAHRPVKMTLLGPGRIMQRFDPEGSRSVYQDVEDFMNDVVAIQRQMVHEVVEAGCRYVQIDEPSYTAYVDPTWIAAMRARGEDPQENLDRAIQADNALMKGFPSVTFGIHICRGNRQSTYHREGAYDAIAERLFYGLDCQRLLLEYDTERAGSFDPLKYVPQGKTAVLGIVSTKFPQLEDGESLRHRIEEASRFLPLDQLALSPQCGFASSLPGNLLSEDDQWRKLELVQQVAVRTWG